MNQQDAPVTTNLGFQAPTKLTDWKNQPTLAELNQDFEAAKLTQRTHISRINGWAANMANSSLKKVPGRSSVQPKLIRKQAEWRYPALSEPFLSSEKLFTVRPRTWEDQKAAEQTELLLNYQFDTVLNKTTFIDQYVRTATDEGTVIVRTGWERHEKTVKERVPEWGFFPITTPQQQSEFQEALDLRQRNFNEYLNMPEHKRQAVDYYLESQTPTIAVPIGMQTIDVQKVIRNRPTIQIVNTANLYIDPSCDGDVEKAMFIVYSYETSKNELLRTGKYKNLDRINWSNSNPLSQPDHETRTPTTFNFQDEARRKIVAYEYWGYYDIHANGELVPFVATWIDGVLIQMEESPFPDKKLPFVVVPFMPIKKSVYGEPDGELLTENQQILGAVTRGMIDLMGRSANAQQGIPKGFLDTPNRRRYDAGLDYEYNPQGNINPVSHVVQHKYPELPQSALVMAQMQNQEAESLTGVKTYSDSGLNGGAYGNVAAGIRGLLEASSKREIGIIRRLARGLSLIGAKIAAMNAEFLSEEETLRITNTQFVQVRREDLVGRYDTEVDVSSAEADNVKAQELAFMLQTLGNNADGGMVKLILSQIAKLRKMPALAHMIENFQPEPDPMQERKVAAEIAELEAKVAKLQSEQQKNQAQAQYYLSAARRMGSQADLDDLAFVEQETGTTHARELQKQGAQARANQDLEVTKGIMSGKNADGSEAVSPERLSTAVQFNAVSQQ